MTLTIQTKWTYELFEEAMLTFEHSLNRTVRINCPYDTETMISNIATWAKSRGHKAIAEFDRKSVRVQKRKKNE